MRTRALVARKLSNFAWINSESIPSIRYLVIFRDDGVITCNCLGYYTHGYSHPHHRCKHIIKAIWEANNG